MLWTSSIILKRSLLGYLRVSNISCAVHSRRSSTEVLSHSYDHGNNTSFKLLSKTVGQVLDETVEKYPDREAIVFHRDVRRKTFAQFNEKVDRLAGGLLALGLHKGDRVGVWGQNHMEWLLAMYACMKAGFILVNVNQAYKANELKFALNKVGMKALFLMHSFKTTSYYDILKEVVPEIENVPAGQLKSSGAPSLQHVIMTEGPTQLGTFSFDELLHMGGVDQMQELHRLKREIQFDDPINIQFTSGTTGSPKGVVLTHHNIVNNAFITGNVLQATRICIPVPLYHCFGMVLGSLCSVVHGMTQVFPVRGFESLAVLEAVHKERCTAIYGTPVMFIDVLNNPNFNQYDLSSLRTGIMAGSPCPLEVMKQIVDNMGCTEMLIAYGLTETSPLTNISSRDDPISLRVSTIGKVAPFTEVKVVDRDGKMLPVGEKGELCYRGHCVMQGYWEDDKKTQEAIDKNNWFHTGDLGTIDENGYCKILGRSKDMIIRGGENVYPVEVEEFLYQHPSIEDVQVVGVPDKRMGEEIAAVIRLKSDAKDTTADDIRNFCKGKMSHFKIPQYVEFVDVFPLTVTGKIKKHVIRDELAKKFGN